MIEITRDENVDDLFKIWSCLYMQIQIDLFRKSPTQCYNCSVFHHASQNCSMKTRCLKCGEEHRTGQCTIKEKIENPTCINCNAQGLHRMTHLPQAQKGSISHFHVPTPPLLTGVEATLVALTPSDQEPFLVASIYAPPNPTYRNLGADFDAIFKNFQTAFLAGDYNAKYTSWGCVNSDPPEAWEDNLSTLNAEANSLWGIAKAFRKKTAPISVFNGPTGIALSDTSKTEVIAHLLESQFQLNDIHNPHKDEIITSSC
ncbi:putative RNA-directed DNA polymerase from transposon X-element [Trichonephila clavipes]|nr:putative RNA-directed DNA polymerase from transposon X-element [Trichonephila clavipes]